MASRVELRQMHRELGSWAAVGEVVGLSKSSAHTYATTDWDPQRKDIREALGLDPFPEVTYVRQVRGKDGRFR
jgi:hypothetical protein